MMQQCTRRRRVMLVMVLTGALLMCHTATQYNTRQAFAAAPLASERYEVLDFFFAQMRQRNITGFLVDGALLGAVRYGHLTPWDHDLEVRTMSEEQDEKRMRTEVLPAMDKRFGRERWFRHLDYSMGTINGCSWNERLHSWKLLMMSEKECTELRQKQEKEHMKLVNKILEGGVTEVVLRDPRGYQARVNIPTNYKMFLEKYGPTALTRCVPDIRKLDDSGTDRTNWHGFFFTMTSYSLDCKNALRLSLMS